jgi:hypothetical protein
MGRTWEDLGESLSRKMVPNLPGRCTSLMFRDVGRRAKLSTGRHAERGRAKVKRRLEVGAQVRPGARQQGRPCV